MVSPRSSFTCSPGLRVSRFRLALLPSPTKVATSTYARSRASSESRCCSRAACAPPAIVSGSRRSSSRRSQGFTSVTDLRSALRRSLPAAGRAFGSHRAGTQDQSRRSHGGIAARRAPYKEPLSVSTLPAGAGPVLRHARRTRDRTARGVCRPRPLLCSGPRRARLDALCVI